MLGPLPMRHKIWLAVAVLGVCLALGGWLGAMPGVPFAVGLGALLGVVVGAVLVYLLVHTTHGGPVGRGPGRPA
ncbi:MAG: hypothetical protein ACI379_09785 [Nocardioides sp.]|uniref:hypothetical protein n=1 Tax=Nocardioides sp. TaxID=35761 RepID=UPI003EFF962A